MYELNDIESRQLRQIQKYIPTATAENLRDYKQCMRTEAIVNCAVPVGVFAAAGVYMMLSKSLPTPKKILVTGLTGITGYICGKVFYTPICSTKAFGTNQLNTRRKVPYTSNSVTTYDQEDQEKKYLMHPDKIEEEASWNNYDSGFENYTSDFDTDNVQGPEEDQKKQLGNRQQEKPKKRITYDDLWRQHRKEEHDAAYKDLMNYTYMEMGKPAQNEERKVSDESPPYEPEDDRQSVWELK